MQNEVNLKPMVHNTDVNECQTGFQCSAVAWQCHVLCWQQLLLAGLDAETAKNFITGNNINYIWQQLQQVSKFYWNILKVPLVLRFSGLYEVFFAETSRYSFACRVHISVNFVFVTSFPTDPVKFGLIFWGFKEVSRRIVGCPSSSPSSGGSPSRSRSPCSSWSSCQWQLCWVRLLKEKFIGPRLDNH
jgi:hypothetical protein